MNLNLYRVVVPVPNNLKTTTKHVSYPASGFPLYTREQAVDVLRLFFKRAPWPEGDGRECWAESDTERFTLHYPIDLLAHELETN